MGIIDLVREALAKQWAATDVSVKPWPPCGVWQDELDAFGHDVCPKCKVETSLHARRCGSDVADFDPAPENPERCDACSRTRDEHKPGARPIGLDPFDS